MNTFSDPTFKILFYIPKVNAQKYKIFISLSHSKHSWGDRGTDMNLNQWALLILLFHPLIERCYDPLQIILVVNLGGLSKVLKC